jgi:hypothetical protein
VAYPAVTVIRPIQVSARVRQTRPMLRATLLARCARLPLLEAKLVYDFVSIGTPVRVI